MTRRFLWALTARFTRATTHSFDRYGVRRFRPEVGLPTEQPTDALGVDAFQDHPAVETPGAPGGLVFEQMVAVGLPAHDLAAAGDLEALRRPAVGLVLGHLSAPARPYAC